MRRLASAALGALAILWCGQASATIMLATLEGDFNDSLYWNRWVVHVYYDTDRGTVTNLANGGVKLSWNEADGTPSPALWVDGIIYAGGNCHCNILHTPQPPYDIKFHIDDFSSFSITMDNNGPGNPGFNGEYQFGIVGDGLALGFQPLYMPSISDFDLDAPYSGRSGDAFGSWNIDGLINGYNYFMSSPYTHEIDVRPFDGEVPSLPEPSAWTLMISGLGLAGAALRRGGRLTRRAA